MDLDFAIPDEIRERIRALPPLTPEEKLAMLNDTPGHLTGYDCPRCKNKGDIAVRFDENGVPVYTPCSCLATRRSLRLAEASGLSDLLSRYTFPRYDTAEEWARRAKEKAWDYVKDGRGKWFYISGHPGTGKTHLCTAVCRQLIGKGAPTRYFLWREDAPKLKALVTDEAEYTRRLDELTRVPVLYIDDFFKGRVTAADINLAFTILNARYNSDAKRTILSSELSVAQIRRLDEAIGGRIHEKARGYLVAVPDNAKDWRAE